MGRDNLKGLDDMSVGRIPLGLRLMLAAILAVGGAAAICPPSFAQGADVYTIGNYPVQAEAKNAVEAKKRAITDGQQAAFRSLLKRIVPVNAYSSLERVKAANANDFISGLSVRSEQNSTTEYIATLDFIFNGDAMRRFLRHEGVPFIDEVAGVTTVVPVFRGSPGKAASAGLGDWGETWRGLDLSNTITPVRMSALQPSVHGDTLKALESGDTSALRIVAAEYGTGSVVFAFAVAREKARRLDVMLVGRDGSGDIVLKRSYPLASGDLAYAMEYGAVISVGILEGRWKATRARYKGGLAVMSGPGAPVIVQVQFSGPGQWYKIRDQLRGIDGVNDMRVAAVSARSAEVALTFPGGGAQLANVLARKGISLRNAGGVWLLRSSY